VLNLNSADQQRFFMPCDRRMAPDFTLPDESRRPVRLAHFRGKVVLLNFWMTWCSPCEEEIPRLIEFQRENATGGSLVSAFRWIERAGRWSNLRP
jgi:thiol-disulfide isomerase/thioredoxin